MACGHVSAIEPLRLRQQLKEKQRSGFQGGSAASSSKTSNACFCEAKPTPKPTRRASSSQGGVPVKSLRRWGEAGWAQTFYEEDALTAAEPTRPRRRSAADFGGRRHDAAGLGGRRRLAGGPHGAGGRGAEPVRSFYNAGVGLCPVAEGERSEGRGGGLRGASTRSHGAQAARSATKEPDFARRAMDSRRHTRRGRAEAGGVGCSVMVWQRPTATAKHARLNPLPYLPAQPRGA